MKEVELYCPKCNELIGSLELQNNDKSLIVVPCNHCSEVNIVSLPTGIIGLATQEAIDSVYQKHTEDTKKLVTVKV